MGETRELRVSRVHWEQKRQLQRNMPYDNTTNAVPTVLATRNKGEKDIKGRTMNKAV